MLVSIVFATLNRVNGSLIKLLIDSNGKKAYNLSAKSTVLLFPFKISNFNIP